MFRDYCPVLLTDCTAEPIGSQFARSNRDASVLLVEMLFGWTTSSEAYLHAIESMAAAFSVPLA
jgi:ureidoacrylate peracid hydrolase